MFLSRSETFFFLRTDVTKVDSEYSKVENYLFRFITIIIIIINMYEMLTMIFRSYACIISVNSSITLTGEDSLLLVVIFLIESSSCPFGDILLLQSESL